MFHFCAKQFGPANTNAPYIRLFYQDCRCFVIESGHFQLMLTTDLRLGYFARLQSPYMNTTGQCLELFYWPDSSKDESVLSIIVVSEEKSEATVNRSISRPMAGWNRLFARLPSGVYRIVIEGRRGDVSYTGLAVDDIILQPCEKFGNFFLTLGLPSRWWYPPP